ncbi:radical SAM protein [Geomesophilobacter sediminis]|uniref:Radical SAM protein n=1 Tax=Geomesophilobacter sediminis TaxID=2798584 RepID=A0A8J7JE54_9BACT|nr:radical SAM protein [Geomesophilobacter sediminis]MBJ6725708.1 radical SAM protein [Geomesophilobacter sediminis]
MTHLVRFLKKARVALRMHRRRPTFVSFNVTNRCNEACPMCSIWRDEGEDLPLAEIERIFTDLRRCGFLVSELSGGEPFLRPDLFEVFKVLDRLGFLYTLTTNGTLVTGEQIERLSDARGLLQLAVSLDSLRRDTYRALRGCDLLPDVLNTLDRIAAAPPPQPVKLNMTLSRLNYQEVFDMIRYARARGFFLSVFPVSLGGGFEHRADHPQFRASSGELREMATVFVELSRLKKEGAPLWEYSGFYEKAAGYLLQRPMGPCGAGELFVDLHSDGKLAPCIDLPTCADLRQESAAAALARMKTQSERIRSCSGASPCCYTCSYNISLTAEHPVRFVLENARRTVKLWVKKPKA